MRITMRVPPGAGDETQVPVFIKIAADEPLEYKYDIEPRDSIPDLPSFHESIFGDDYHSEYEDGTLESLDLNVTQTPLGYEFENDDAAWVMACTFMIFTMQTGMEGTYIQGCHMALFFVKICI